MKMYYWNQTNFEGLASIHESYRLREEYVLFADYCQQKEQGLKKQANASMNAFVEASRKRPLETQRAIAEELLSLDFYHGEIHQLMPYPLRMYFKSLLLDWIEDAPKNAIPYRWLGYLTQDVSYYEQALERDPTDEVSLGRLVLAYLNCVDYQTHHLSESLFLGDFDDARATLQSARLLLERMQSSKVTAALQAEWDYYNRLLTSWQRYLDAGREGAFPEWCKASHEIFNFYSIVYYDQ